jgi:hypothetical protein
MSAVGGGAARRITELSHGPQAFADTADAWTVAEHAPARAVKV